MTPPKQFPARGWPLQKHALWTHEIEGLTGYSQLHRKRLKVYLLVSTCLAVALVLAVALPIGSMEYIAGLVLFNVWLVESSATMGYTHLKPIPVIG